MKLHFKKYGDGAPVIILHGLFGMSDNWISIAKDLAKDKLVFLLDMRNHGRSPHIEAHNYSDMIEDIYEFLTDMNLRQVNFIGHSMGGKAAMNFAFEYPHRVNKLVIIDISPRAYPVFHSTIIDSLLGLDIDTIKSRKEANDQLAVSIPSKRIRQFLLKNLYRKDNGSFSWRINLPVIAKNLMQIGAEVKSKTPFKNPTLFIRGAESEYIGNDDIKLIEELYPDAKIVTIPNASHWVHSEAPEQVFTEINKFL